MEAARKILAIAGKFPGDYVDGRFNAPEGDLTANLGRMPLLEKDGQAIGQSVAINFYLATENNLMGDNAWEAAQILSVYEHLKEMNTVFRQVIAWGAEPTEEQLTTWFDSGATDVSGPADGSARSTRYMKWWMGRIEATLGNNGFAVGNRLSLADVLIYEFFGEYLAEEEAGELPSHRREPFSNKARTDAALASHPKLNASVNAVASNANIQKWLKIRGQQNF
jgi:glutathione S-transferase